LLCAAVLSLYLNPLTFWLCVAAVPVIILYPLAKRVFPVPQLVLSLAWGFAVLISWTAVTAKIEPATCWLWGATVLWTLGFDTVYAMSDREDDRRIGVKSSALFFGNWAAEAVAIFFAATAALLIELGLVMPLNWGFWVTVAIASSIWIWQYLRLRQPDLPNPAYSEIFRQNVFIGFVLLAGMILGIAIGS
jgi:4-hydroxybenzoate polyprenyltransferase